MNSERKLITERQKLFPEEEQMPLVKYFYDYPFRELPDDVRDVIYGPPMDPNDAVKPENFTDWFKPCGEYEKVELGYCMLDDGVGYVCTYMRIPDDVDRGKMSWYMGWLNHRSKSMIPGHGNLRYKIWNPADHYDHYYVNWHDDSDGIFTTESLDIGKGDRKYNTIRHPFSLYDYGWTKEKNQALIDSGCPPKDTGDWESFDTPGAHLAIAQIRPTADGGAERRSVEWIGLRPENGKLIREYDTFCDEEYLQKVANHTLIEWYHMTSFINDLYAEYHDKPIDAD